jgi:hypothetical protein
MTDWWSALYDEVNAHFLGLIVLLELFYPCTIIAAVTRYRLKRQTSRDSYEKSRFTKSNRLLAIVLFVILEAPFLYPLEMNLHKVLLWMGTAGLLVYIWRFPDQIQDLSVFPESVAEPLLAKMGRRPAKPRGYLTSLVRGDQLNSDRLRRIVGIQGNSFYCYRCRTMKGFPDEYGATLIIKRKKSHVCADCVQALPQLKVADLRVWMVD